MRVQWLATLGPITWDFLTLDMKFMLEDRSITLWGIKVIENTIENSSRWKKHLTLENKGMLIQLCHSIQLAEI